MSRNNDDMGMGRFAYSHIPAEYRCVGDSRSGDSRSGEANSTELELKELKKKVRKALKALKAGALAEAEILLKDIDF